MKKVILTFSFVVALSLGAFAQKQIDPKVQRDPLKEADSKHDLDVAWQYFRLKKAYKAVLARTEVIVVANPDFSRLEDALYLSGMSSYFLSEGKGKQKIDAKTEDEKTRFAPAKLRDDAAGYLSQLLEKFPQTQYKDEAERTLKNIGTKK
jgi:outer membrane protein assembly factor BamD (BamD/ComL family)